MIKVGQTRKAIIAGLTLDVKVLKQASTKQWDVAVVGITGIEVSRTQIHQNDFIKEAK